MSGKRQDFKLEEIQRMKKIKERVEKELEGVSANDKLIVLGSIISYELGEHYSETKDDTLLLSHLKAVLNCWELSKLRSILKKEDEKDEKF